MVYTDLAEIQNNSRDVVTSAISPDGAAFETKARIESEDLAKKNSDGVVIVYKRLYILPPSITIKEGDYIKALKIGKKTVTEDYMKAEIVFPVSRRSLHHYEVWCK